ncbi:cytochrome P450 [Nocardia jejuensis]|uniref:cytochrome P450 n=1 Tax=Nocardia jejuensis TaxID=328049 RepID=UPI00083029FB|nr:cytochrome P450 [Nocardia jejuensis]
MTNAFSPEMRRNPYPLYQQIRSSSPLLYDPELDMFSVFDYEGVKMVLTHPEIFSSGQPSGGTFDEMLISQNPPRHTKLRALVSPAFTPRLVSSLHARIDRLARDLLDRVPTRGEMDLVEDFAMPLPMTVIAEMLGVPEVDRPQFKDWTEVTVNMSAIVTGGDAAIRAMRELTRVKDEMRRYFHAMLAARRAESERRDDVIGSLLEAEVEGERLTDAQIFDFFHLLLAAGSETTTNLIGNTLLCLLENPDQFELLQSKPNLLPNAIEEVLRYRSPAQIVFRWTARDVEVHGQMIPAGKTVLVMIGSANRDPKQFDEPERFDITRRANQHIAFGHSNHFCLGASLTRLEAKIGLTVLFERACDIELAGTEPWQPVTAFHMYGPATLPIRFTARAD